MTLTPISSRESAIPLSRHDVRRVHEKFFSREFERTDVC